MVYQAVLVAHILALVVYKIAVVVYKVGQVAQRPVLLVFGADLMTSRAILVHFRAMQVIHLF